jgi:hypothetical protein
MLKKKVVNFIPEVQFSPVYKVSQHVLGGYVETGYSKVQLKLNETELWAYLKPGLTRPPQSVFNALNQCYSTLVFFPDNTSEEHIKTKYIKQIFL